MIYFCCDKSRRALVEKSAFNGIDYLEVLDHEAPAGSPRQQTLLVHCLKAINPSLGLDNLRIFGGERITPVRPVWAFPAPAIPAALLTPSEQALFASLPQADHILVVRTDSAGDYSTYRLALTKSSADPSPPDPFDVQFSAVDFSFKVECPSDFDCAPQCKCPPTPKLNPNLDYLAKDYASFRRLLLDRMSQLSPGWQERHAADLGVALVEVLAYVGDYLSYRQDAVATEAYLRTARSRVSVRRHARLVDYAMHDGCNARVFVQVQCKGNGVPLPVGTALLSRVAQALPKIEPGSPELKLALEQKPVIFETMHPVTLFQKHSELKFYTWADARCCLPQGATRATLSGHWPDLLAGDVLIFEEIAGPLTGQPADADRSRRHAVRLTHVVAFDAKQQELTDTLTSEEITEISWAADDALPFPFCISAVTDEAHGSLELTDLSVARGNIVLADHGWSVPDDLGNVPRPKLTQLVSRCDDRCEPRPVPALPARFRPGLNQASPLTFAMPFPEARLFGTEFKPTYETDLNNHLLPVDLQNLFDVEFVGFIKPISVQGNTPEWSVSDGFTAFRIRLENEGTPPRTRLNVYKLHVPASRSLRQSPAQALPEITLESSLDADVEEWEPRRDLINSHASDPHFVVEIESDRTTTLRFGDNEHGAQPEPNTHFTAALRVGNGVAGNIGADSIAHIVINDRRIISARNPLPAVGGVEPESSEQVRQYAPAAFFIQERAVTEADYAEVARREWPEAINDAQRAVGTFRWTGSWHTVFVTVDRFGGRPVDAAFREQMTSHLERFRMAGHDLEVDEPRFISLALDMHVCARPDHFRSRVKQALLERFSSRILADGSKGVFHPDNFTFGQTVYLSPIIAAAQAVPGVASVVITKFERQEQPDPKPLQDGRLTLARLEIPRLDNNPDFPEHGVFTLDVGGGK